MDLLQREHQKFRPESVRYEKVASGIQELQYLKQDKMGPRLLLTNRKSRTLLIGAKINNLC